MRTTRELHEGEVLIAKQMRGENGSQFPWHAASLESALVMVQGSATLEFAEASHELTPGQTFVIPADIPHRVIATPEFTAVHVMPKEIRFEFQIADLQAF